MSDCILNPLKGHLIQAVTTNEDHTVLVFHTESGSFSFSAEGCCCSFSWIEHINSLDELIRHEVEKTEEIEVPEALTQGGVDYVPSKLSSEWAVSVYMYKLYTAAGSCTIEMRNSSNGYYGDGGYLVYVQGDVGATVPVTLDF